MVLKMAEIGSIAEENIDDNRNEEAEQLEMGQLGENWRFNSPPRPCSLHSHPRVRSVSAYDVSTYQNSSSTITVHTL